MSVCWVLEVNNDHSRNCRVVCYLFVKFLWCQNLVFFSRDENICGFVSVFIARAHDGCMRSR